MINDNKLSIKTVIDKLIKESLTTSIDNKKNGKYTYIIGNNGTGKSRMLGELAKTLRLSDSERITACISNTVHDRFTNSEHEKVIYMGARNSTNAVFLSAMDKQLAKYILQAMEIDRRSFKNLTTVLNMNISFVFGEKIIETILTPLDTANRDTERVIKRASDLGLLSTRKINTLKRIIDGNGRFEQLTKAQISTLRSYLDLNIDFSIRINLDGGQSVNFHSLSSGEQNRFLTFAKILSVMKNGIIYLIDEPEVSLHLHWQMDFHSNMDRLLSDIKNFHVIVATHSPTIISEAVKYDNNRLENTVAVLQRECEINNIKKSNDKSVICKVHTFAEVASHDQLVLRHFQTSPYKTREVSVEIADVVLSMAEGEKAKNDAVNILNELRTAVGLSNEAKKQINAALALVENDLINSLKINGE
ncbi:TPA: ATP-binding protein [Proteus mirabilis]|uniref:AAA family ATPase n=1 Tax=Proteus mirabilis TaxID=584 RepID=UPI001582A2A1|nr:AAA family ATPase [Proteus mirabilis]EKT9733071.1 ATP-binding protein [Proteus mirabilis]EKW6742140.1 ATP-binding protein [Proteus mirabilis]MBI6369627.1 ATP-binding protein [Proteus mirabilis]MCU6315798.1 ATP-binding protein [Proteus mirabilis]HCT9033932.1 ATP-binding protein [Proteus mirabilis]